MNFIIRTNGLAMRLVCLAPRWLVPGVYNVRVEQDCSSFARVHLFKDNESKTWK